MFCQRVYTTPFLLDFLFFNYPQNCTKNRLIKASPNFIKGRVNLDPSTTKRLLRDLFTKEVNETHCIQRVYPVWEYNLVAHTSKYTCVSRLLDGKNLKPPCLSETQTLSYSRRQTLLRPTPQLLPTFMSSVSNTF